MSIRIQLAHIMYDVSLSPMAANRQQPGLPAWEARLLFVHGLQAKRRDVVVHLQGKRQKVQTR